VNKRWILVGGVIAVAAILAFLLWPRGDDRGAGPAAAQPRDSGGATAGGAPARARGGVDGRVVDERGQPVAGAVVRAVASSRWDDQEPVTATTGGDGGFALDVVAGRWSVTASAPGRVPGEAVAEVAAGERTRIQLRLVAGGASVAGRVVDATGGSVGGALVVLAPEQGVLGADTRRAAAAMTDGDGKFEVGVVPGRWRVATTHPEYVADARSLDVPASGATIEISLVPGGVVEGTVRDRGSDAPVAGARVSYAREVIGQGPFAGASAQQRGQGEVTAGADGSFRITGLGAGRIILTAQTDDDRAGDEPTEVLLGIAETATDVDVFVAPALSIAGRVVYDDGSPAAGAGVTVQQRGEATMVTAGDDGRFRVGGARPGRYRLRAEAEDSLKSEGVTVEVDRAPVTDVVLTVARGAYVTGRVEPAGPAEITVIPEDDGGGIKMEDGFLDLDLTGGPATRTAADGTFRIGPFPPGTVTLGGKAPDGKRGETEVTVDAGGAAGVVIALEARGSIAGRVATKKGVPVPGAVVSLRRATGPGGLRRTTIVNGVDIGADRAPCDGDGRFAVAGLDAGTWELTVLDDLGAPIAFDRKDADAPERVELAANQQRSGVELVVEAKDGVIEGVVLGPDGAAVPDAWVTVAPEEQRLPGLGRIRGPGGPGRAGPPEPEAEPAEGGSIVESRVIVMDSGSGGAGEIPPVLTDSAGRFAVKHLRRGTYRVNAEGLRGGARGSVGEVATGSDVTVKLQTLSKLAGTVTMGGKPVVDYAVSVDGPTRKRREVHDDEGEFTMHGLDPGAYEVEARTPAGTGRATVTIEAGRESTVAIDIQAQGIIKGKLVDASGAPIADRMVIVGPRQPEGSMSIELGEPPPTTGADGSFTAKSDAGPRTFFILGPNGPDVRKDLDVVAGQTLDLGTLTAEPPGH
jgi:hypothetical protein